jgi:predicted nucleotidyltransferase
MKSGAMMEDDPILRRIVPTLSQVNPVAAIMLGGSRARGTAHSASDYDIGLYFLTKEVLDTGRLLAAVTTLVDDPLKAHVTPVGGWGPWIVGGGWLSVEGRKVDLLYRNIEAVAEVIEACRAGNISMHYQPGHPHGFCSAIWMGEVVLGLPLHDPARCLARLKARSSPYPAAQRHALIRKFQWEILFSIENAEIAVSRGEETHMAGCVYRALACLAQVLFALNERHLINEKGALPEAAMLPLTIPDLSARVANVWRLIGDTSFSPALLILRSLEQELAAMSTLPRANEA